MPRKSLCGQIRAPCNLMLVGGRWCCQTKFTGASFASLQAPIYVTDADGVVTTSTHHASVLQLVRGLQ
jgi:hypothetical protein